MQLSDAERQDLLGHLDASSERFLKAIDGVGAEQWGFAPPDGAWSIAQCAGHVVRSEGNIFEGVLGTLQEPAAPERAAAVAGKEKLLHKAVPARRGKAQAPAGMEPADFASPAEAAERFREVRAVTRDFAAATDAPLHVHVKPHFGLGDLTAAQWLLLIALHSERHARQIEEVKAMPGYPDHFTQSLR